jgi:hypothetical protein
MPTIEEPETGFPVMTDKDLASSWVVGGEIHAEMCLRIFVPGRGSPLRAFQKRRLDWVTGLRFDRAEEPLD